MKMDKLKKDDIQLEKTVSELKERLKYKDEQNLNLIQRNRELKAKLGSQLSLKNELTEKELLLTVGLESLLLLPNLSRDEGLLPYLYRNRHL